MQMFAKWFAHNMGARVSQSCYHAPQRRLVKFLLFHFDDAFCCKRWPALPRHHRLTCLWVAVKMTGDLCALLAVRLPQTFSKRENSHVAFMDLHAFI